MEHHEAIKMNNLNQYISTLTNIGKRTHSIMSHSIIQIYRESQIGI